MLDRFSQATRAWFDASFAEPTPAQVLGWDAIAAGDHTLVHAPTGSGKTLAAFLWAIDGLLNEPTPERADRCRVVYVSPLKALAYDIERNLRAPLAGIRHSAERLSLPSPAEVAVGMRTGDTPPKERQRMVRTPPDILITTPESLYLMLTSRAREMFHSVTTLIVDEVHAVAASKRGAHLAVSLERLEELCDTSPQRIGLSATQRPLSTIGGFLAGGQIDEHGTRTERPVTIVDVPSDKTLDIELIVPVEDMTAPDPVPGDDVQYRSIWPSVYPRLLELIRQHSSTIVFANSRRLSERICAELNTLAGEEIARAHHGSVSREHRVEIEELLKSGSIPAVVATSSLELGIDMGAVDLVIQIESPTSVASGLQRVGRAGHQVGAPSVARVFPKFRGDLLEATVVVDKMIEGAVESTRVPRNPLDVLAQQVVSATAMDSWAGDDLFDLVRRAAPFAELGRRPFEAVLDMLSGKYPSDGFAELRPRVIWDRVTDTLEARPGAHRLAVQNPGTIPDRGLYRVTLPDGTKVGELDEEMVYESRPGDAFILGASSWKITEIGPDRVEVVPAPGEPAARMPFWRGDALGRPLDTGKALGAFVRELGAMNTEEAFETLQTSYRLDRRAAQNLVAYIAEERAATGLLPTDRTVVIERFRDEIGDWRLVILSPLGAQVHAPWAMALTHRFRESYGSDVNVIWSDDGIAFRFPDADQVPDAAALMVDPDEVEEMVMAHLMDTAMFSARFREAAARALLLPRRRPDQRTPLWLQRRKAADLLSVAKQFGSFPIMLEAYREILQDDFDMDALVTVLRDIQARRIAVVDAPVTSPSPFASSLLFDFVAAYLYETDAPLAERRAAALSLDRELLRELLGEGELRQLLDPEVVASVELELQRLADGRRATTDESIYDLLRDLGPLTTTEVDARAELENVEVVLERFEAARRIITVMIRGESHWAAVEDAGRLRDALGVQPPVGVPHAHLETVADPLGDVVGRFARTHGPFHGGQIEERLGLPRAVVATTLQRLEQGGRVVRGAFSPGAADQEWIDTEVLRRLKRRSLAALRNEIEPVDQVALARFLPTWHGMGGDLRSGRGRLTEVLHQLQGAAIPASILETHVLAARLNYAPHLLDELMVTGEVVWVGREPLGARDGRVALYARAQAAELLREVDHPELSPHHQRIVDHLEARGASFFSDLYRATEGGDPQETLAALWDLVWWGLVTNDSLAPLRAFLKGTRSRGRRASMPDINPPSGAGRWWLTAELGRVETTQFAAATSAQLLERHGVLTREAVLFEKVPGAFTGLYPVLTRMEETGRARRGYFVEGMGGAQFALAGAVERIRGREGSAAGAITLAAADPANPYGAALSWPESEHQLARAAGASVVLVDGVLAVYLQRGGKSLITLTDDIDTLTAAAGALHSHAEASQRKKVVFEKVDGAAIGSSPLGNLLTQAGFTVTYKGLTLPTPVARRR